MDNFSDTIYGRAFLKGHACSPDVKDIFLNGEKSDDCWLVVDVEGGWGVRYDLTKPRSERDEVEYVEGKFDVTKRQPDDSGLPKLLVVGHARHGKDTVGEMLRDRHGFKFTSSSMFVAQEVMWDNWGVAKYANFEEMFEDRVNHRVLWMEMISAYNTPDKTKTASTMLERGFDMYVGMRRLDELEACRDKGIFDYIVWVDASDRHPPETGSSDLTIESVKPDYIIENNGTLEDLERALTEFTHHIMPDKVPDPHRDRSLDFKAGPYVVQGEYTEECRYDMEDAECGVDDKTLEDCKAIFENIGYWPVSGRMRSDVPNRTSRPGYVMKPLEDVADGLHPTYDTDELRRMASPELVEEKDGTFRYAEYDGPPFASKTKEVGPIGG